MFRGHALDHRPLRTHFARTSNIGLGLWRDPSSPDDRQRSQTANERSGAINDTADGPPPERQTKRPPHDSEAAFLSGGLFARRAPALGSPRRRGFLSADRYHTDFGGGLELGGSGGYGVRLLVDLPLALVVLEDHFVVGDRLQ